MENEIWKDIPGYEGYFMASDLGRIKSLDRTLIYPNGEEHKLKGRILIPKKSQVGYLRVNLSVNRKVRTINIHRLVAETFIPNPENKDQINHLDGDKTNNKVSNIVWSSCSENILHAYRVLGKINPATGRSGVKNPISKPVLQFSLDGELIAEYPCISDAAKSVNCTGGYFSSVCNGRLKTQIVRGYIWKFKHQDNEQ